MAMKKIHDFDWYEIWTDGKMYNVYDPAALAGKFRSEIRALEWIANLPDPKSGDRGPIRFARHSAKCLLNKMLLDAQETVKSLENILDSKEQTV